MRPLIVGAILFTSACWLGHGQPATPPKTFEVASVKPGTEPVPVDMGGGRMMVRSGGCTGGPGTTDPGRLTCQNASLLNLVTLAYGLKKYQYTSSSYPGWMEETRFDIVAKIPPGATREDVRLMEQNLLSERFKLAVHFEKKEMPVYELTVGKNGHKLKESPPSVAAPVDTAPPALPPPGKMEKDRDGFIVLPRRSGGLSMSITNGRMRIQADDQSMEQFVSLLINQLGRPVTDATGLTGKYDITLICAAEGMGMMSVTRSGPGISDGGMPPAMPEAEPAPTLFEAVQQQLGLKLEQKKGTIDLLMVDQVEKVPTEN